jgi:bombesin-like receptor 3
MINEGDTKLLLCLFQIMVMFHFLAYYAVPLGFIATFYIIMARHLVLSTKNMPGEAQGQAKQIQARKKARNCIK